MLAVAGLGHGIMEAKMLRGIKQRAEAKMLRGIKQRAESKGDGLDSSSRLTG
jgi:hypothetical protein